MILVLINQKACLFSLIQAFDFRCEIARGSQRERDRERAAARAGGKGKNGDDGLTPEQRRERYKRNKKKPFLFIGLVFFG